MTAPRRRRSSESGMRCPRTALALAAALLAACAGNPDKRTLAVRFGSRFARAEYALCVLGAYALVVSAWLSGLGGDGWLLPLLSLPFAAVLARAVAREDGAALNRRLGGTAKLQLAFGALLCAGVLL